MKKFYEAPELELVKLTLVDVILSSKEGEIKETIGGDDEIVDDILD